MGQRGQLSESALHYLIVMVAVGAILGVGYYSFSSVSDRLCKTELSKFQLDVKGIDREVGDGSLIEKEFSIPCDAEEVYFVDPVKAKAEYFANPLIKDAIASSVEKNVFVVKDGEVESSFYAGDLELAFPGYSCLVPRSGEVNVFAEGKGKAVEITPGCYQTECTLIPQNIPEHEAQQIIDEFISMSCERCPTDVFKEVNDYAQTLQNLNVYRRYTYCPDTGKTKVEIIISPKDGKIAKNFRFYEYIPKECISNLNAYLESLSISGEVFVQDDPLLMWQFDTIDAETTIEYTLNRSMERSDCEELIKGLGITEALQEEDIEDHYSPTIEPLGDEVLTINQGETQVVSLNDFVHDDVSLDEEIVWEITPTPQNVLVRIEDPTTSAGGTAFTGTGGVVAEASIGSIGTLADVKARTPIPYHSNFLVIKPKENFVGSETVYLKAKDRSGKTSTGTLKVIVTAAPKINTIPDVIFHEAGAASKNIQLRESLYILDDTDFVDLQITVSPPSTPFAECSITGSGISRVLHCQRLSPGDSEFTLKVTDQHGLSTEKKFSVKVIGQSAAPFKQYKCRSTASACGFASYACPTGTTTPIGCCPVNALSSLGNLIGVDACWGDNYANIRYACNNERWSTCGGSCSEFSDAEVVEDRCCNSPSCTAPGSRCDGDETLVTCADSNGDGCLEQSSPTACANGCRDGRCLPSICANDNDCRVGYSCHSGSCKKGCDVTSLSTGSTINYKHGACATGPYGENYKRCNNGNLEDDYACITWQCSQSPGWQTGYAGGCPTWNAVRCSGTQRQQCSTWTPSTGSSALCLGWYTGVSQCTGGQTCQSGQCVASVCTPNYYRCYSTTQNQQCKSDGSDWGSSAPLCGTGKVCLKSPSSQFSSDPCEWGCTDGVTAVATGKCIGPKKCYLTGGSTQLGYDCNYCASINGGANQCPASAPVCKGDGTCGAAVTPASLSATITSGASYQESDGVGIYTVCPYSISVTNSGGTLGSVGNRYLDGELKESYSETVPIGGTISLGSEVIYSEYGNAPYSGTVAIYDSNNANIGSRTITCP